MTEDIVVLWVDTQDQAKEIVKGISDRKQRAELEEIIKKARDGYGEREAKAGREAESKLKSAVGRDREVKHNADAKYKEAAERLQKIEKQVAEVECWAQIPLAQRLDVLGHIKNDFEIIVFRF